MIFTNSKIKFKRGDDDALLVALGNGATFTDGDKIFFSLKTEKEDEVDILQIESTMFVTHNDVDNSAAVITIEHKDTIDLALGEYYYDILIQWANTKYVTIVPPTEFTLVPGGSHATV
jgi:hypothetical protein